MSEQSMSSKRSLRLPVYVWQLPVRLFHWINALAITVLFITGMYIGHPVMASLGDPTGNFFMGNIRYLHGMAAFIYTVNMLYRLYWFWAGNEYAKLAFWRKSFWQDIGKTIRYYLFMTREHTAHVGGHNALAQLSYLIFIWLGGAVMILTGLAMRASAHTQGIYSWFSWLIPTLKGEAQIRTLHHLVAWLFVVFVLIHLYLVFRQDILDDDGTVSSIINGYKYELAGTTEQGKNGGETSNFLCANEQVVIPDAVLSEMGIKDGAIEDDGN